MPAIPAIMLVVSVASSVYSGVKSSQAANAEEDQQRINNQSTMDSAIASYGDLSPAERDAEAEEATGGIKAQSDYLRSVGEMNVISGASGTYGGSVDSMLRDLKTTRGRNMSDVIANRATELDNVKAQAEQIRYGARANMQTRIFSKPTVAGIALNSVSAGAQGYSSGLSLQKGYNEYKQAVPAVTTNNIKGGQ